MANVERCKYRHDWYKVPATETTNEYYVCRKCNGVPKGDKERKHAEAYVFLRNVLPKGSTVYTILKHVSRSGMTRGIDCYAFTIEEDVQVKCECQNCAVCGWDGTEKTICGVCKMCTRCHSHKPGCEGCKAGESKQVARPLWITSWVGHVIDSPQPMEYWRKSLGLKVNGCGMDMGFHVVNSLSYALYDDGYAIKHAWL